MKTELDIYVIEHVKRKRVERGFSQAILADCLGMSRVDFQTLPAEKVKQEFWTTAKTGNKVRYSTNIVTFVGWKLSTTILL